MTSRLTTFIQTANLTGSLKITVPNHFLKLSPRPSLSSSPFLTMSVESLWKMPLICFTSDPESPRVGSVCLPQSELCLHDLKLKRVLNSPNLYRLNSVGPGQFFWDRLFIWSYGCLDLGEAWQRLQHFLMVLSGPSFPSQSLEWTGIIAMHISFYYKYEYSYSM